MSDLLHHLALPVGYVVADYRIERLLGAGGFGITYLAQDLSLDKQVAVKEYFPNDMAVRREGQSVLAKTSADDDGFRWGLEEFLAEARRLARFDHPNIIKIHRYFEAHGTAYIVMEFAEGITLAERLITEGTLDEAAVRAIFGPLADGLATVHAAGLLHRDIKPGNIILRADGRPVLIDFGAARHATGGRSHSVTAIVSGGYSPFEQYSTTGNQGPWTDVYAFGSVIYTSMTGNRMPPAPDRIADRQGVLDAERFAALTGRASPALMEMIKRSLQVYAEDRPSTMSAWQACFSGSPEAVEPVTMEVSPNPPDASPEVENPYASSGVGSGYSAAEAVTPTIEPVKAGSVHAAPKQGKQPVGLLAGIGVLVLALLGVGVYQLLGGTEDTPVALVTPDPASDPADLDAVEEADTPPGVALEPPKPNPDPVRQPSADRIRVDGTGGGDVRDLPNAFAEAVGRTGPVTIEIAPGVYDFTPVPGKPLTLIGAGAADQIVLRAEKSVVIRRDLVLQNLTLTLAASFADDAGLVINNAAVKAKGVSCGNEGAPQLRECFRLLGASDLTLEDSRIENVGIGLRCAGRSRLNAARNNVSGVAIGLFAENQCNASIAELDLRTRQVGVFASGKSRVSLTRHRIVVANAAGTPFQIADEARVIER